MAAVGRAGEEAWEEGVERVGAGVGAGWVVGVGWVEAGVGWAEVGRVAALQHTRLDSKGMTCA